MSEGLRQHHMELNFSDRWDPPAPEAPLKSGALVRTEPSTCKGACPMVYTLVFNGQALSPKQEVHLSYSF